MLQESHKPRIREGFPGQRMIVLPRPVVHEALSLPATADLLPSDIGYYPLATWHDVERDPGVSQMIVIYCVRGKGWARFGGQTYEVAAGSVLVIPPNVPHHYWADEEQPWTIYWFHAVGKKIPAIQSYLSQASPVFSIGEDSEVLGDFEEVYGILQQSYGPGNLLLASLHLGHLLGRLIRLCQKHFSAPSTRERIEQTIAFMKRRINSKITVPELARTANLSSSHFSSEFKKQTGYPVLEFFIRLKMQHACRLLDSTQMPIKAVASELGFDDPLYFSRQFRRVYEVSPAHYRSIRKG